MRCAAFLIALGLAGSALAQDSLVTGLSTDNVALNATFDGSEIFVFGAVQPDSDAELQGGPLDIIITIKGPESNVTVRRKERRFGIWINTDQVVVRQVPSFYAVASTSELDGLLSQTELLRHGIGMSEAVRRVGSHPDFADTQAFADAVVRIRQDNGLYERIDGGVMLAEDILFQAHFALPANLVEGSYAAEFFLVRGQAVTGSARTAITVEKTGIERWLFNLSQDRPLAYGLLSLLVALSAGWLAATAFGRIRR
jgi:uncharacterized protein (TIGR02186 family)